MVVYDDYRKQNVARCQAPRAGSKDRRESSRWNPLDHSQRRRRCLGEPWRESDQRSSRASPVRRQCRQDIVLASEWQPGPRVRFPPGAGGAVQRPRCASQPRERSLKALGLLTWICLRRLGPCRCLCPSFGVPSSRSMQPERPPPVKVDGRPRWQARPRPREERRTSGPPSSAFPQAYVRCSETP